jgi:hypothetical protein
LSLHFDVIWQLMHGAVGGGAGVCGAVAIGGLAATTGGATCGGVTTGGAAIGIPVDGDVFAEFDAFDAFDVDDLVSLPTEAWAARCATVVVAGWPENSFHDRLTAPHPLSGATSRITMATRRFMASHLLMVHRSSCLHRHAGVSPETKGALGASRQLGSAR